VKSQQFVVVRYVILGMFALVAAGCATTPSKEIHQFEPVPVAKVHSQELSPTTRNMTELLREAQKEFEAANTAQEKQNRDEALQHYTKMLDLLGQANLDPSVFYNLRNEFERILNNTPQQQQASLLDRKKLRELHPPELSERVVGDLQIEFPLSERVLTEIDEIQNMYPKPFQRGLDRSYKYLPRIRSEFAKAGLPLDLAWLAMVESQFHPKVVSRAGAGYIA